MAYKVTVYFDNMVDETHYFDTEEQAIECKSDIERKYQGQRLYKVRMEEIVCERQQ